MTSATHARAMTDGSTDVPRYDLTIRVVMWLDAFWSVAFVLAAPVAAAIAIVWTPSEVPEVVVVATFVSVAGLALCGAITGVLADRADAARALLPARRPVAAAADVHATGPARTALKNRSLTGQS